MKLSRYEQETIISYNEDEKTASVYTHNAALQRRLAAIAEERPEECKLIRTMHDSQAVEYQVPKRWVKVRPNRILTEEQLQAARAHAMKMLANRRNGVAASADDGEDFEDEDDFLDAEDDYDEENPPEDGEEASAE